MLLQMLAFLPRFNPDSRYTVKVLDGNKIPERRCSWKVDRYYNSLSLVYLSVTAFSEVQKYVLGH